MAFQWNLFGRSCMMIECFRAIEKIRTAGWTGMRQPGRLRDRNIHENSPVLLLRGTGELVRNMFIILILN